MAKWNLPGDARLALSIVVNVEEGAEMNITEGDRGPEIVDELGVALHKPVRNYSNESNYLYGLKAGAPRVMKLILDGSEARVRLAKVGLERANGFEDLGREGAVHRSLLFQLGHAFVDACKACSWCAARGSRLQWLVDLESHRRQHR